MNNNSDVQQTESQSLTASVDVDFFTQEFLAWAGRYLNTPQKIILGFAGVVVNTVIVVVFTKQGLKDSVTITLFALALADFGASLTQMFRGIIVFEYFLDKDEMPLNLRSLVQILAVRPHFMFVRTAMFLTMYICVERCLCVAMPFLVRSIFTIQRTVCYVIVIYVLQVGFYSYLYATQGLHWKTNKQNITRLVAWFSSKNAKAREYSRIVNGIIFPTVSLVVIITATVFMVLGLQTSVKWRQEMNSESGKNRTSSKMKETRVMKMVVIVAVIFVTCSLPDVTLSITRNFVEGLESGGQYSRLNVFLQSPLMILDSVNSASNIFVYYFMSSSFRMKMKELCCRSTRKTTK